MKGIILDETGDFALDGGRIKVEQANGQSVENILRANRGEFKEAPLVGGEVWRMLGGNPDPMWCATVKKQIQSVGIGVSSVEMTDNQITVTE